jgi:hypothetical protein
MKSAAIRGDAMGRMFLTTNEKLESLKLCLKME